MKYNEQKYFPKKWDTEDKKESKINDLSIHVFGNRLYKDQTLYEYLIEFLLVFISPKYEKGNKNGEFKFHTDEQINSDEGLKYFCNPRIGLKRFVFFNNAKAENKFLIDRKAYGEINDYIKEFVDKKDSKKEEVIEIIKDMFYGFSAVLKSRSWFAQSLMPLVPEMILTESIGAGKDRGKIEDYECNNCNESLECLTEKSGNIDWVKCEKKFDQSKHSFFARGGEVYYLHILQALENDNKKREKLENLIKGLFENYPQFSQIANFIQERWEEKIVSCRSDKEEAKKEFIKENRLKYISEKFRDRSSYTYTELENLLSLEMDSLKKLELLSIGMMLQIFRMMHVRVSDKKAMWVLDFSEKNNNEIVKKYAINSMKGFEEDIEKTLREFIKNEENQIKEIKDSRENSILLVRKLGKEIKFIIPITGVGMRMTLNEELVRFLVLSIVKPGKKMQFTTFIEKLYEHFGFVIGPEKFKLYLESRNEKNAIDNSGYFEQNIKNFEKLVKKCGFLRELSDATSIVENPYIKGRN